MKSNIQIQTPIDIEIEGCSVYVRFSKNKVFNTVDYSTSTTVITVDYDKNSEVIGIECVGFKFFSLKETIEHINLMIKKSSSGAV